jgi:hypothetical protein
MTLYKFNKLSQTQQIMVLEVFGTKVDYRSQDHYQIALFQISSFYVEAFYPGKSIKIEKLQAFTGTSKLKPYLEKIDIKMLLLDILH